MYLPVLIAWSTDATIVATTLLAQKHVPWVRHMRHTALGNLRKWKAVRGGHAHTGGRKYHFLGKDVTWLAKACPFCPCWTPPEWCVADMQCSMSPRVSQGTSVKSCFELNCNPQQHRCLSFYIASTAFSCYRGCRQYNGWSTTSASCPQVVQVWQTAEADHFGLHCLRWPGAGVCCHDHWVHHLWHAQWRQRQAFRPKPNHVFTGVYGKLLPLHMSPRLLPACLAASLLPCESK